MPVHVRYADNVVNSGLEHTFSLIIKSLKWHTVYIIVSKRKCVFVRRKDYFLASKKKKKKKKKEEKESGFCFFLCPLNKAERLIRFKTGQTIPQD